MNLLLAGTSSSPDCLPLSWLYPEQPRDSWLKHFFFLSVTFLMQVLRMPFPLRGAAEEAGAAALAEHHGLPAQRRSCCAGPAGCGSVARRPSLWLLNKCCHFSPASGANSHSDCLVWHVGLRHQRETTVSEPRQKSRKRGLIGYSPLSLI